MRKGKSKLFLGLICGLLFFFNAVASGLTSVPLLEQDRIALWSHLRTFPDPQGQYSPAQVFVRFEEGAGGILAHADQSYGNWLPYNPGTGAQQMAAVANLDMGKQFKELAAYVGVAVGATEWAQIQAKRAAGDVYATETEGQFVDRLSGPSQAERLVLKQLDLFDANKDGKFVALAANVPQYLLSA